MNRRYIDLACNWSSGAGYVYLQRRGIPIRMPPVLEHDHDMGLASGDAFEVEVIAVGIEHKDPGRAGDPIQRLRREPYAGAISAAEGHGAPRRVHEADGYLQVLANR